jgi:glycosyltransferase involved in cell wall biosynthesis
MSFREPKSLMKLLAIMEAGTITGPAKNLLSFCQNAQEHGFSDLPFVKTSITTFRRASVNESANVFVEKALDSNIQIDLINERFRFDTQVVKELKSIVERTRPDVIQTHNVKSHFIMRLSELWRDIPWIAFHHGYTTTDVKMRAYNQLDRWSLRKAHRVVTMNKVFAKQLMQAGANREGMRILHNAIDVESILNVNSDVATTLKNKLGIAEEERVIIAIGRLSKEKGQIDLVRAFAAWLQSQAHLQTKLIIVGDGPERERLEQEINSLGIKKRVVFAGQVSDVKPFYAIADLMVLPSHSEGSPNVLLEAMAANVPVVATSVGGVPEIATHKENALLVEARNSQALAQAISQLLDDREFAQKLATNAQQRVIKNHSPQSRLRSLLEIYRELTPNKIPAEAQLV